MSVFPPSRTITIEAALRDLAQGSPKARVLAAHGLGDAADADRARAIKALIGALDDTRAEVRAEAAASLGSLCEAAEDGSRAADHSATEALARRLGDGDAMVRQNAAIALGAIRDPAGFDALADTLRDGTADARFQAATSLAEVDAARAHEPLVEATRDRDKQVASAAALALGAIGDARAVEPLAALLEHAERDVRFDAAYALAELRDPRGRELLGKALDEPDRAWDAVTALEWLGGPESAAALAPLLSMKKADPSAQLLAAGAILRTGGDGAHAEAAKRTLLGGLGAWKLEQRALAVEQLGTAGGDWAIAPLEKLRGSRRGRPLADAIDEALATIRKS